MSYTLDQEQADFYSGGGVADEYELVTGTFALPLAVEAAEDQAPVTLVQAHAPYRIRRVRFDMTKQGAPPVCPKPVDTDAFTFVGGVLGIPAPTPNLNGTFEWQVVGEYTFVSGVYNAPADGYVLTSLPFVYPTQVLNQSSGAALPEDVEGAGIGPKAGYTAGQQVDLTNPNYGYNEPTYLPGVFFSGDLVSGPTQYPQIQ